MRVPPTSPSLARPKAVGLLALALAIESGLVRMARGAGILDLALGEALLALADGGRLIRLGSSRIADYARERLGVPESSALAFMQLARETRSRPILRRAVRAGVVSPRKALIVARVATGEDEAAWTAAAAALTQGELTRRVKSAGISPPEEWDIETLLLRMDPRQQDRLDAALAVAREVLGPDRPRWQLIEAIAMEFLGDHAEWISPDPWPGTSGTAGEDPAAAEDWLATWRSRSTSVLRQLEALEAASSFLDARGEIEFRDPHVLDARLQTLMQARRGFDDPLGRQAELVSRLGVHRALGFETFEEYCRERLGMSARTVRQRIWLEVRMTELPALRAALASGRLTYSKALWVARGATGRDVRDWIDRAASTTCQQTAREAEAAEERQNRRRGVRRIWGPEDATETVRLGIACAQAAAAARGGPIDPGEALATMADHFVAVWSEHVARERQRIGTGRLRVLARTLGLCAVPGCSRAAQHEHHVRFRSRGGGEEVTNRIAICDTHHLEGIHGGWMAVEGKAGERLVWSLGIRDGEPEETWIADGDDEARRISPAGEAG